MTVYFLKAREQELFKIGYTSKTVRQRRNQLQVGCPYPLDVYAVLTGDKGRLEIEAEIHDQLSEYNTQGEWFEVEERTIKELLGSYGITMRYEDVELETGLYVRLDRQTDKVYVDMDTLPMPRWDFLVYMASGDVIIDPHEGRSLLNILELILDHPETAEDFGEMCDRLWPERKPVIWAQIQRDIKERSQYTIKARNASRTP